MFQLQDYSTHNRYVTDLRTQVIIFGHQQITNMVGIKNSVPVLGATGSGKSTFITTQLGGTFKLRGGGCHLISCPVVYPKMSDENRSQTLHTTCYHDKNGISLIDTGGLGETRGREAKRWVSFSLYMLFATVSSIKATVVVLDYNAFKANRGTGAESTVEQLRPFLISDHSQLIIDSMVFVFKNATTSDGNLIRSMEPEEIKREIRKLSNARKSELKEKLKDLPRRQDTSRSSNSDDVDDIDWAQIEDETRKDITNKQILIRLLERIQTAPIIVSFPHERAACQKQREEFLAALGSESVTSIEEEEKLREIAGSFAPESFNTLQDLGLLVQRANPVLRDICESYETVKESLQKNRTLLDFINGDWNNIRIELIRQNRSKITAKSREITDEENEIKELRHSDTPVLYEKKSLNVEKSGNFFEFLFGSRRARGTIKYKGIPFDSYELEDKGCLDKSRLTEKVDKDKRKAVFHLQSKRDHDLHVVLKIFLMKKNHPATKTKIGQFESKKKLLQDEIKILEDEVVALQGVTSADSLRDFILNREQGALKKLKRLIEANNQKVEVPHDFECPNPPTHEAVLSNVAGLLKLMRDTDMTSDQISPILRSEIATCIELFDKISNFKDDTDLRETLNIDVCLDQSGISSELPPDTQMPKLNRIQNVKVKFMKIMKNTTDFALIFATEKYYIIGVFLQLFSFYYPGMREVAPLPSSLLLALSGLFILVGFYKTIASQVAKERKKALEFFKSALAEALDEVRSTRAETIATTEGIVDTVADKLAQKVNVDLQANIDTRNMTGFFSIKKLFGFL